MECEGEGKGGFFTSYGLLGSLFHRRTDEALLFFSQHSTWEEKCGDFL